MRRYSSVLPGVEVAVTDWLAQVFRPGAMPSHLVSDLHSGSLVVLEEGDEEDEEDEEEAARQEEVRPLVPVSHPRSRCAL